LPQLNEWAARLVDAGAISGFVLDTYEPEADRYGGPAAIDDAERLFQADSEAVVGQLAELASGRLSWPVEVLAAANFVELLASLGDWDWPGWVLDTLPIELQHESKSFRQAAFQLIDPRREWPALQGCPAILAGWARRAEAAGAYGKHIIAGKPDTRAINGVLHLHANRLVGLDRNAERTAYGILRTAVRAYVGRLRSRS
jgi:thiopeptide-type bacteriocin biosynthesis protein